MHFLCIDECDCTTVACSINNINDDVAPEDKKSYILSDGKK